MCSSNLTGGATTAFVNILQGMKERGHEIMVLTALMDGPLLGILEKMNCPYVKTPICYDVYPKSKNKFLYLPKIAKMLCCRWVAKRAMSNVVEAFRPDIIHTNVGPLSLGYDVSKKYGIPHVWHHREYQDLDFGYRYYPSVDSFLCKTHETGNYNICITRGVFNYRHFRDGIDKVIYDGVFSKNLPESHQKKDGDYVLFVGRVEEAKGTLDVVRCFSAFSRKYPDMKLKIAGNYNQDNPYYKSCVCLMREMGVEDKVEFLGNRDDVYQLMASARMLIVPSRFEGFGFITAEAMANGCLVIGRNTAGTKEQFDKGLKYTGKEIALRFTNDDELVAAMDYVMSHDMTEMRLRAKETVFKFYTIEEHVDKVEQYYRDILTLSKLRLKNEHN